jgi:hypothetical protein
VADFLESVDTDSGKKEPTPVTIVGRGGEGIAGVTYADVSIASMTANQAAGTDPARAANAARRALMINPPSDCMLAIAPGATRGWPLFANVPNTIVGQECPTNVLYLIGLTTGAAVSIWEA